MKLFGAWPSLIFGVIILGMVAFVGIPYLNSLEYVRDITNNSKDSDIDATDLFYSEAEHSSEAENYFTFTGESE